MMMSITSALRSRVRCTFLNSSSRNDFEGHSRSSAVVLFDGPHIISNWWFIANCITFLLCIHCRDVS